MLRAVARRAHRDLELVLDGHRDAAQWTVGSLGEHPLGVLGERRDDRVHGRIALLDALQRRAQQLAGVELAGGDPSGLSAEREVLGVAHEVGARLGSRSVSGQMPLKSTAISARSSGPKTWSM